MKVVFLRSNPVKPDPRVEKQANALCGFGYEVMIVGWNRSVSSTIARRDTITFENGVVPVRRFNIKASFGGGLRNLLPLLFFQICLLIWLTRHHAEFDVIHACDFDTVIPAWFCATLFRKKYVYDIFDYYTDAFKVPKVLKPIVEKVDVFMINNADAVIIVNESRKVQIKKSAPKHLVVIHNSPVISCGTANRTDSNREENTRPKFVYVGILSSGRLLEEVIEVFKERSDIELHIGGFGPLEDYVEDVSEKHDNIFYYGTLPYSRVLELQGSCDVMFATYDPEVPNHKYSSPNKLYEAMALGKPVIVARGTGIDTVVESHGLGIVVEYSKEGFSRGVDYLISNSSQWGSIAKRGRAIYETQYSWRIMEKRLRELYERL